MDDKVSLSKQVLDVSRDALLLNLRFMRNIFSMLELLPIKNASIATDGIYLRYDPNQILAMYLEERSQVARMILHISLHNVFLHSFPSEDVNHEVWDLSCDIVVEKIISELALPVTYTTASEEQKAVLSQLDSKLSVITAETVYNHILDLELTSEEIQELRKPFYIDDHDPWYQLAVLEKSSSKSESATSETHEGQQGPSFSPATKEGGKGTDIDMPDDAAQQEKSHKSFSGTAPEDKTLKDAPVNHKRSIGKRLADTVNLDRSKDQWENAAYEMGIQLDSYIKLWGSEGSNLTMNLKSVTRKRQDYSEFLRKFVTMGEEIKVNDDEFDYVFYCYGLATYENMPLIEPLEYVEENRIRDFVIAIDTSASTKDGLVRKFIEKTYSIFTEETSFSTQMNVLIIQCDAEIKDVQRINSPEEIEDYIDNLEIKGLGGTDFRPVFSYVENAIEEGELTNLGGLVYFTDGQGTFPTHVPDYKVAFIFADEQSLDVEVPSWAAKLIL